MSKNNPFYWFYGIPVFNTAHKFVYLDDLNIEVPGQAYFIYESKKKLHQNASDMAATIANELSDQKQINNALDFLKNVADNERTKELLVIQDYQKYLKEILPEDDKNINYLLSKINTNILENPEEINEFYLELTKYINNARQSHQDYISRLQRFLKHNDKKMSELAQDSYQFRALEDLQGTFNNLIGIATKAQEKKIDGFIGKLRAAAFKYVTESNLVKRLQSGEDVAAAFTIVQLDIEKKCQDFLDEHFEEYTDLSELEDEMDTIIDNYFLQEEEHETKLQKAVDSDNEQLTIMLDAAKNILGLKQISEDIKTRESLSNRRTDALSKKASLRKQLKDILNEDIMNDLQHLQTSIPKISKKQNKQTSNQTFHGNLFELIEIIQEGNTIKVRGKNGTDVIHLGSIQFDVLDSDIQTSLLKPVKKIEELMTNYDNEKRKDRNDNREKAYRSMNKSIHAAITTLEKQIKNLDLKIDNLFIYHESLKLYKTAETNEMSSFEGRDMTILNYIDNLYSANGLAGLSLPQKDSLEFLALNLSSLAVGGPYKSTVAEYLSIFAGLLMFDDVYNMAKEASKVLQGASPYKTVKQIHLYNLNGIYVPASMLLTYTYTTMKNIENAIEKGRAARVTINTKGADEAITNYLNTRPVPIKPEWSKLGNAASSGTTVRILFLASFVQFLQELSKI